MFDFLFFNRDKEIKSLAEVIAVDLDKLNMSKLAIEKAISMVAKAIAKSDILIQTDSSQKRNIEYRLNVQPNDHECGTVFWTKVIKSLLTAQEALIIPMNNKYYRAASWQVTDSVLSERTYSNVMLNCAGANYGLYRTFQTKDVIHLRYDNSKIRLYLQSVVDQYDRTLDAVNAMIRLSNQPKYKLKIDGNMNFREKKADGTDREVTRDEYMAKIKRILESDELSILPEANGIALESLTVQTNAKAEELAKIALTINNEVANAFDIPEAVFNGNITEKSDATNEFITYACSPVAEVINDTLTAYIVAFTIAGYYTMGTTGVRVNEYDQTKAMENADLIIASCYANGRAVDDNVAVIFDVTKLEEYVLPVTQATIVQAGQE